MDPHRPPRPDEPPLKWVDSGEPALRPDVVQVQGSREEMALLFGTLDATVDGSAGRHARLERRIVLSPGLAKQLAMSLGDVARIYESRLGRLDTSPAGQFLGAHSDTDVPEGARVLFERVRALQVGFGFEKSFKMAHGRLLDDRLILGVRRNLPDARSLLEVCRSIGMPAAFLDAFTQDLPEANTVGFGYEGGERGGVYKVYLEFWDKLRERLRREPANVEPALLFLGFKWDANDGTRAALARYTCRPLLSIEGILRRLDALYEGQQDSPSLRATRAVLGLASRRIDDDSFVYVEATEEGNPRKSFDLNLYKAGLRVNELLPVLSNLCRDYAIGADALQRVEAQAGGRAFGHLSGGLGRDGKDFLTVYYELEGL